MKVFELPLHFDPLVRVVSDVTAEDVEKFFDEEEQERLASFQREKRRAEWAASRVALKQLALDLALCESARECRLLSANRRPQLTLKGQELFVSISHSKGAGAAAIAPAPIGIDLQMVKPIDVRATKFFLNPEEADELFRMAVPDAIVHFWAAKEAALKLDATIGWYRASSIAVREERVDGFTFEFRRGSMSGRIVTARVDGFVLAIAQPSEC